MAQAINLDAVGALSVEQRLALIEAIWATIVGQDAEVPMAPGVLAEMKRRAAEMRADPSASMSLEEFRAGLRKSL